MCTLPLKPLVSFSDDSAVTSPGRAGLSSCRNGSASNGYLAAVDLEKPLLDPPLFGGYPPFKPSGMNGESNGVNGSNPLNGWHGAIDGIHDGVLINGNGIGHANGNGVDHPEADKDSDSFLEAESVMVPSTPSKNSVDEFFDAFEEDYVSEDESQKHGARTFGKSPNKGFFRDLATRLHQENMKRTAAEEALQAIQQQRDALACILLQKGIPLPGAIAIPDDIIKKNEHLDARVDGIVSEVPLGSDPLERLKAGSTEGIAQESQNSLTIPPAEESEKAGATIEKNKPEKEGVDEVLAIKEAEIARLKDKLQYWEQMNIELSRQNQQASELSRAKRKRYRQIRKGILIGLGIAVGVGITISAAYGLLPSHSSKSNSHDSEFDTDWKDSTTQTSH